MRTSSLLRQAIGAVLLIESLSAVAFVGTAVWHERRTRLKALDITLLGRSDSLVGAVQDAEDPEDRVMIDREEFDPPASDVYVVYSPGGRIVGESQNAPAELVKLFKDGFRDVRVGRDGYRVLQREALRIIDREETNGVGIRRPVTVIYAERTDHIWHEVLEAVSFYVIVSLLLLCVTAVLLIYLLRLYLQPLRELAAGAADIQASSLVFDPPVSALHVRELNPLAEALTKTMTRLRGAFEAQHRFISDAAHELKTAVAVVRSTVEVLSMRNRPAEEYRRGLDQLLADNERVETLVSRMLTLARFDERSGSPATEVDLSGEVAIALDQLESFAKAHCVVLRRELAGGAQVRIAPDAVQVLVSNLVMNAVQHSPQGADVVVAVRMETDGERWARLEVQDFGAGVAPEDLAHVFERFYRADKSRSRATGGAGLGLAICKGIVESAGGSIEMQSVQGRGSTVTARLPLC